MELVVFGIAVLAILGAALVRHHRRYLGRQRDLRAAALALGLEYREEAGEVVAALADAALLTHGRNHRLKNALVGERGPLRVALGDLTYDLGSGRATSTLSDSACVLRARDLRLPRFRLAGHSPLQTPLLDDRDIDFDDDRGFSRAFALRGGDEAAVRALFTAPLRAQLMSLAGRAVRVDGGGDTLVLADPGLVPPAELHALLERATGLLSALDAASRAAR